MSVIEAITEKSKRLSPEVQNEILRYVEYLSAREQPKEVKPSQWKFAWAGGLKDLNQTAKEAKEELRELWHKID
jgi:hypothetical protein